MNLYKMDIYTKRKRRVLEAVVHAPSMAEAESHIQARYPKCEIRHTRTLLDVPKHFIVGEWETD